MFIKDTFKDWDEKCIKVVYFDNLNYIRTFSIEEFKEFFHIKSVSIQKHAGGFLYFENIEYVSPVFGPKFHLDWGLVYGENTPEDPVISVVMENMVIYSFLCTLRTLNHKAIISNLLNIMKN